MVVRSDIIMKNKNKCHTVGTVPKRNRKVIENDKIDTVSTQNIIAHFPLFVQTLEYLDFSGKHKTSDSHPHHS
jgi:hypothetical protein